MGQLADLAVLSGDYMSVPEEQIRDITSVLTVVGGNVVYGDGSFSKLAPPLPPASPDWSPVNKFGGYYKRGRKSGGANGATAAAAGAAMCAVHVNRRELAWFAEIPAADQREFWGALGCTCWMA